MDTVDERIKTLIKCPIDWRRVSGLDDCEPQWLLLDWYASLTEFAVSDDEKAIFSEMADSGQFRINDDNESNTLKNIEWRLPEAITSYQAKSGRLSALDFIAPSYHGKHFKLGLERGRVVKLSKGGPSLFFRDISSSDLRAAFWTWFDGFFWTSMSLQEFLEKESTEHSNAEFDLWKSLIEDHQLRIAMNARTKIGASNGEVTSRLCFDLHLDSRTVHAYPVSEQEAVDIMRGTWVRGDEVLSW